MAHLLFNITTNFFVSYYFIFTFLKKNTIIFSPFRDVHVLLTSSLRTPKFFVKEFSYFLMPCHQHGLRINLLVQR